MPLRIVRREGEIIRINDDIKIKVLLITDKNNRYGKQVVLEFDAPEEVKIWRHEIYLRKLYEKDKRAKVTRKNYDLVENY